MEDQENPNENDLAESSAGPDTDSSRPVRSATVSQSKRSVRKYRMRRLVLKELRETLRDRRTIVTLILMPLLVYPALSLVFKTYLLSNIGIVNDGKPLEFAIVYSGDTDERDVRAAFRQVIEGIEAAAAEKKEIEARQAIRESENNQQSDSENEVNGTEDKEVVEQGLAIDDGALDSQFLPIGGHKWAYIPPDSEVTLEQSVESGSADVGIFVGRKDRGPFQVGELKIVARDDQLSLAAAGYLKSNIKMLNEFALKVRLREARMPSGPVIAVADQIVGPEKKESTAQFPLASLVPLILVMMTITGAVYPAIDLTAGERERGTLETLMAAPIPRFGILFSKFLAVLTVAVMTAILNLIGMFATIWVFQLDRQFGGGFFNLTVMIQILLLLVLFAAFFSALLLAVTSFAKSFKEAQVYLIPIILLSLGPGLMAMAPGMSLDGVYAVVPMMNILLLARDVILGQAALIPATVAVVSTLVYSFLAIQFAAWIFGSDGILNAGGGSFVEMFQRPLKVNRVVPIFATLFCLVLLFPINFASIGYLGRLPSETSSDLSTRYILMGVFTFFAFMAVPWMVAKHQNTNIRSGFGLNRVNLIYLVGGLLLGISLWTIVMSLTSGWHEVYGWIFGAEKQAAWHQRIVEEATAQLERVKQLHWSMILICFSIIPAVCEEWFFRGMLLRSLLKTKAAWKAIVISAIVFGVFHMISSSAIAIDRLVPSTLVGLMLGYLAYKSNSIWPGILLHSLNNAIVIFLAYYEEKLRTLIPNFPDQSDPIPMTWLYVGGAVTVLGLAMIVFARRTTDNEVDVVEEPKSLAKAV